MRLILRKSRLVSSKGKKERHKKCLRLIINSRKQSRKDGKGGNKLNSKDIIYRDKRILLLRR
jgi:hypothetical protein